MNETITDVSYGVANVSCRWLTENRKIEIVRKGRVRRAKLFYLRDRVGKKARVRGFARDSNLACQRIKAA